MAEAPEPRPGILEISPYAGGEAKIPGVERPIRLASNEGALGPSATSTISRIVWMTSGKP